MALPDSIEKWEAPFFADREFVEVGGLMSYGPNFAELFRHVATFVDKIVKGAKPLISRWSNR
jgi:ABC-type uncharacterized transport system substrate-binding protein